MRRQGCFAVAWLAAAMLASAVACAQEISFATAGWNAEETAIRGLLDRSVEAFNRGDLPGHLAIYDENVHFMTATGPRPGIAPIEKAFRENYFRVDGRPKQQLRFERLAIRRVAADVAIATARFVLSGGGWKAIHDHSS